ncbi:MAG: hypothetical protein AAFY36_13355 [Bacteroidota bacterium]
MLKNNIQKAYRTTKLTGTILGEAGGSMLRSSIDTAKEITKLYQNAGYKAFTFGKGMVRETVKLTLANQKELLKTSGTALREVVKNFKADDAAEEQQEELTIDDVLKD